MQEMVMNGQLAYATKRTYVFLGSIIEYSYPNLSIDSLVFDNYTWDRDDREFSEYNGKLIPARTPLSSMIAGNHCLFVRFVF